MMNDKLVASVIGFWIGVLVTGVLIEITNTTYIDGQIDALSGNNIKVEKVENERGELVWQMK